MTDTHADSSSDLPITDPVSLTLLADEGRLEGNNGRYEKHLRDLAGLYRDGDAYGLAVAHAGEEPVYWVESSNTQPTAGGLITGISVLEPGRIGHEYAMTRGHLHANAECAETYLGLTGTGVMLLETVDGRSEAVEVTPGQVVYVPGGWVHRSVNVGTERFSTLFVYSAVAGQDYEIIATANGMKQLVVEDGNGGWTTTPNPDHAGYRP